MDAEFWLERWRQSQIGFHQADTNPLLQTHWPALNLPASSKVLVPLCGKTLDMVWLAGQGHHVVGVELSQLAIDEFFATQGITPQTRTEQAFTISAAGPYELWCGDFFALPGEACAALSGIYDRASLIALPPDMRMRYAAKLIDLNRSAAEALLITLEYNQSILPGPPHAVPPDEVKALFGAPWSVVQLARGTTEALSPKFKEHGLHTVIEAVYRLSPRAAASA